MNLIVFVILVTLCVARQATGSVYNFYDTGKNSPFVAFSVATKTNVIAENNTRLPLDIELYNDEKHFCTKRNMFTAPIKGVYSFSFGAGGVNGKQMHLTLKAGNPEIGRIRIYDFNKIHGYGSATVILKLNKGDTASIWVQKSFTAHGNANLPPSTFFTGNLVKSLNESCN